MNVAARPFSSQTAGTAADAATLNQTFRHPVSEAELKAATHAFTGAARALFPQGAKVVSVQLGKAMNAPIRGYVAAVGTAQLELPGGKRVQARVSFMAHSANVTVTENDQLVRSAYRRPNGKVEIMQYKA